LFAKSKQPLLFIIKYDIISINTKKEGVKLNTELISLFIDKVGRKPNDRDMSTLTSLKATMSEERIIELILFWTETKEKELTSFAIIPYLKEEYELYLENIDIIKRRMEKQNNKETPVKKIIRQKQCKVVPKINLEDLENE